MCIALTIQKLVYREVLFLENVVNARGFGYLMKGAFPGPPT